jgi:hypothetical protein
MFIYDLQKETQKFDRFDQEKVQMELIMAKCNDEFLFSPHYGYIQDNNSVHATSNVPKLLLNNQTIDVPMVSLTRSTARNPASIITSNVDTFIKSGRFKVIPKSELSSVMFNNRNVLNIDDK